MLTLLLALATEPYESLVRSIESRRIELASSSQKLRPEVEQALLAAFRRLTAAWIGTRWGLGLPQTDRPREGKVNCGTFVGTILSHAGFRIDVRRLQRQPSQMIIRTFVADRRRVVVLDRASMPAFRARVKALGPGLFIIGLDFHVGFLLQTADDLRFVHASYETGEVVDEPAASAVPITSSDYRIVGKLLDDRMLRAWLDGANFRVQGSE